MNVTKLDNEAVLAGATHYRIVNYKERGTNKHKPFSKYYFDKEGKEVAYFVFDTVSHTGLTARDEPIEWGEAFINDELVEELVTL